MTIQEKLQEFAEIMKMSVIARRAGVHQSTISRVINQGRAVKAEDALGLARALGVSVEWLIDDEQGWPPVYTNREPAHEEQAA